MTASAPSSRSSAISRIASRRLARVHLVAAAVAELRRRVGGLAERAVEGRGRLGGVGEDGAPPRAGLVERPADRGHAAVHHVGGRDDVGAGPGVRQRDPREQRERRVVVDVAVADDAAVAVRGVLVEADVGHDERAPGPPSSGPAHGLLHGAAVVPGLAAGLVLALRDAEEDDRAARRRRAAPAPRRRPRPARGGATPGSERDRLAQALARAGRRAARRTAPPTGASRARGPRRAGVRRRRRRRSVGKAGHAERSLLCPAARGKSLEQAGAAVAEARRPRRSRCARRPVRRAPRGWRSRAPRRASRAAARVPRRRVRRTATARRPRAKSRRRRRTGASTMSRASAGSGGAGTLRYTTTPLDVARRARASSSGERRDRRPRRTAAGRASRPVAAGSASSSACRGAVRDDLAALGRPPAAPRRWPRPTAAALARRDAAGAPPSAASPSARATAIRLVNTARSGGSDRPRRPRPHRLDRVADPFDDLDPLGNAVREHRAGRPSARRGPAESSALGGSAISAAAPRREELPGERPAHALRIAPRRRVRSPRRIRAPSGEKTAPVER